MDTVSSTNQPSKQVDGAGSDEIALPYDTKNEGLYLNHSCSSGPPQW